MTLQVYNSLTISAVNSMGVPIPNLRLGRKLKTVVIAAAWLSKLGSVARGTERIIKDPTEQISDSNEGGEKSKNEDITNGRDECSICEKYVKPISYTCPCQICSCILHLSCAEMKDWRCPTCHKDPLQNISDQLSKDKSRSKRTFGEMVKYDLITDDDDIGKTPISISC
jgi:hypothetical protein